MMGEAKRRFVEGDKEINLSYINKLMKGNSFFYAIVGMTVAATLSYLNKATGKHVDSNEKGEFLLKMNKLYKIVGYVSLVMGLIVTIGPILTDKPDAAMFVMMFLMFLIF